MALHYKIVDLFRYTNRDHHQYTKTRMTEKHIKKGAVSFIKLATCFPHCSLLLSPEDFLSQSARQTHPGAWCSPCSPSGAV